jgi:hypothetical protein
MLQNSQLKYQTRSVPVFDETTSFNSPDKQTLISLITIILHYL